MRKKRQRDQLCSFDGCRKVGWSKGLCRTHYWQQWRGRELTPVRLHARGLPPKARFDRLWRFQKETGCWLWEGAIHPQKGYGMFWFNATVKNMYAHRAAWVLYSGDIPDDPGHVYGTQGVLHTCDNGLCVNPEHLFLGTHTDNMQDASRKGSFSKPRPHKQGEKHPHAKVTADIVRAIRASTDSQAALGRMYGISRQTVGEIQRREIWAHVKDEPMAEALDPTQWPKWLYHVTLPAVMVATPDDEAELPEGYRPRPFSPEEQYEHAKAAHAAEVQAHDREVARLERELQKPVTPSRRPHRRTRR